MATELISIRLDRKAKRSLEQLAERKGVTRTEVLRRAVEGLLAKESQSNDKDPYGVWARVIGSVRGPSTNLSERTGEKFTQLLRERERARRGKRR